MQYEIEIKKFSDLKGLIEIPKFQRGLVWNTDKKKEFIKTLKEGLPIGVLLLAPKDSKYLIIDGLQRFSTMMDYANNYFDYISIDEITEMDLSSIIISSKKARTTYEYYQENGKIAVNNDMREVIIDGFKNGVDANLMDISQGVTEMLCKKISIFDFDDAWSISNAVYKVLERIQNNAQIDDIKIPLIIFTGKEDKLADIFQKLNQGVKLSKYDVFAATWINHTVTIKEDKEFIDLIIAKYETAEDESCLEISDYDADEMRKSGELTVFEYAFALSKSIMGKCNKLFKKVDEGKVDSIGFLILAELLGLTYQEMGTLAERISEYESIDYKKLKDLIVECAQTVENALGNYIMSPGSKRKRV